MKSMRGNNKSQKHCYNQWALLLNLFANRIFGLATGYLQFKSYQKFEGIALCSGERKNPIENVQMNVAETNKNAKKWQ